MSDAIDESRIARRQAMQAVLGGAAAAAVFTAPRVTGFSVAPDYLAAATVPACTGGGTTAANQHSRPTNCNTTALPKCWTTGNAFCGRCNSGAVSIGGAKILGGVTVNANMTGGARQSTGDGRLYVT